MREIFETSVRMIFGMATRTMPLIPFVVSFEFTIAEARLYLMGRLGPKKPAGPIREKLDLYKARPVDGEIINSTEVIHSYYFGMSRVKFFPSDQMATRFVGEPGEGRNYRVRVMSTFESVLDYLTDFEVFRNSHQLLQEELNYDEVEVQNQYFSVAPKNFKDMYSLMINLREKYSDSTFYFPGDGIGIGALVCTLLKLKFYSYEPNSSIRAKRYPGIQIHEFPPSEEQDMIEIAFNLLSIDSYNFRFRRAISYDRQLLTPKLVGFYPAHGSVHLRIRGIEPITLTLSLDVERSLPIKIIPVVPTPYISDKKLYPVLLSSGYRTVSGAQLPGIDNVSVGKTYILTEGSTTLPPYDNELPVFFLARQQLSPLTITNDIFRIKSPVMYMRETACIVWTRTPFVFTGISEFYSVADGYVAYLHPRDQSKIQFVGGRTIEILTGKLRVPVIRNIFFESYNDEFFDTVKQLCNRPYHGRDCSKCYFLTSTKHYKIEGSELKEYEPSPKDPVRIRKKKATERANRKRFKYSRLKQ